MVSQLQSNCNLDIDIIWMHEVLNCQLCKGYCGPNFGGKTKTEEGLHEGLRSRKENQNLKPESTHEGRAPFGAKWTLDEPKVANQSVHQGNT